jgi:hypothetical protein
VHLNIFQANFSVKYKNLKDKIYWITQGIKVSDQHKRSLYAFTKNSNDPEATVYCKILRKVIKEAKKQHCSRLIAKSNYKITKVGNILKKETGTSTFVGTGYHLTCE